MAYRPAVPPGGLGALRTFYALLVDGEVITANPAKDIDSPKIGKSLPKTLSEPDVGRLVRWAGSRKRGPFALRDKAILLTFFASGLRASELANLKLDDLDIGSSFVKVWNGKGGKDGIAPLSLPATDALERYLRVLRPKLARGEYRSRFRPKLTRDTNSPHVFIGRSGESLTRARIWQLVSGIGRDALGKHVSPHMLRHTLATVLIKGGADISDVQAILRHSDIGTTAIYIHTDLTYLRRIYEQSHPRT